VKCYYCDEFVLPLPDGHRFPMEKYARLRHRVVAEGLAPAGSMEVPPAVSNEQLLLVHHASYVRRVTTGTLEPDEVRRIGFPWTAALVERSRRSVGGTVAACRAALQDGVAVNLAGGTHHAGADRGEGFCVFNDAAVAARVMQVEGHAYQVAIIDCDVHQGNGTAQIFAEDRTVFTLSVHGANNYPFHKARSDRDVALPDGTGDREYLARLARALDDLWELGRIDLAVYVSGADPFVHDRLGRLALTRTGLAQRDVMVLGGLRERGIPVAVVMAGGYAPNVDDTVGIHLETVRAAARMVGPVRLASVSH
jgi:acetoin utilization deacetylase AcuC-like enzyme